MKTPKTILTIILLFVLSGTAFTQGVAINTVGADPDPTTMLDVSSTSSGFLIPRLTTEERDKITSDAGVTGYTGYDPTEGLWIFNTNRKCFEFYANGSWHGMGCWLCGDNITFTYNNSTVTYGSVVNNNKCWMDRNLGASQVATSSTDAAAYGDLFQWGRLDDGHQERTVVTTNTTLSPTDVPGHDEFIIPSASPWDWRDVQNDNLWQGVNGINNPCPSPWRVPTMDEWITESNNWVTSNASGAFGSPLKLTVAGQRRSNGVLELVGSRGEYWSSTISGTNSRNIGFDFMVFTLGDVRTFGRTVRCIRDMPCNAPPVTPSSALQAIGHNQIKWIWHFEYDASGYKYNTVNDYASATDIGLDTFYIQTGLNQNTAYALYVWAYNDCGTSSALTLNASTINNPCDGVTSPSGFGIVASLDKCWLDRNIGATQVATGVTDASAYGHLYQWGRRTDGHQNRTSGTTTTLSGTNTPAHGNFIIAGSVPNDWRSPQNTALWQGVSGTNNPCPSGWRIPTEAEWDAERLNWASYNGAGAFASHLKLTLGGTRLFNNASLSSVGGFGGYWSSNVTGTYSHFLRLDGSTAYISNNRRAFGFSVRCIKD